jgi:Uma2 family endonuclease
MSRLGWAHRFAARRVLRSLSPFDLDDGGVGWRFEVESELRLGERLVVPDVSGWRAREDFSFLHENPIRGAPDWACEVLSPNTAAGDRVLELPLLARHGVPWTWLVDPIEHTLEVYETVDGRPALTVTARDDQHPTLPPFEASVELACWWLPAGAPSS